MIFKNCWLHFKTIIKHKWYVFLACKDCGIICRGIKHDLSKLSPTEFFEYAENYTVGRSPVDIAKEKYGYCKAWLHHRGRNTHHWEYWIDNLGTYENKPCKIPNKYVLEMICDWLGAGIVYSKQKVDNNKPYKEPLEYYNKFINQRIFHKETQIQIEKILNNISNYGINKTFKIINGGKK